MSSPVTERDIDQDPDIDMLDEGLWELYLTNCERDNTKPKIKDYVQWLEENYL